MLKVDINLSTGSELKEIRGIGSKIAQNIVQYRTNHGKFKDIEELKKITGIGSKRLEGMKDVVKINYEQ